MKFLCTRSFYILVLLLSMHSYSFGQCSGNVTLSTQTQVDNFNCSTFTGNLIIKDDNDGVDNIVDLNPIANNGFLNEVTGNFRLEECNSLVSLQGIDVIQTVGGDFTIENNTQLATQGSYTLILETVGGSFLYKNNANEIVAFNELISVGALFVIENDDVIKEFYFPKFATIGSNFSLFNNSELETGTMAITTVNEVFINNNAKLQNVDFLQSLEMTTGSFIVYACPVLQSLGSLENLTDIGINFDIRNTGITEISGFNNVTSLGGSFTVYDNTSLLSISGFQGLQSAKLFDVLGNSSLNSISGFTNYISTSDNFFRLDGTLLNEIEGFNNIDSVAGSLFLTNNSELIDISFLASNLTIVNNLVIQNSPLLNDCCLLMDVEPFVGGDIVLNNNGSECSNYDDIINSPPVFIDCPADITFSVDLGLCSAIEALIDPLVDDNCGIASYNGTLTHPDGSISSFTGSPGTSFDYFFLEGINILDFEIADENGNIATCSYNITVVDDQLPEIGDVNDMTVDADEGLCSHTSDIISPTVSDNCSIDSYTIVVLDENGMVLLSQNTSAGETNTITFPVGENIIEFNAVDASGNTVLESGFITVTDNQVPEFTSCPTDVTITNDAGLCSALFSFTDPEVSDNCGIESYTITVIDANGTIVYDNIDASSGFMDQLVFPVGSNSISYAINDAAGQITTCSYTVVVQDSEAPTWEGGINSSTVVGICGVDDALDLLNNNVPVAEDNCISLSVSLVGSTTSTICGASQEIVHLFEATDAAGNVSIPYELIVVLEDNTPPTLSTPPADQTIFCNDEIPSFPLLTALDDCAGDVTSNIAVTATSTEGTCTNGTPQETIMYTYSVDDGCGNIATETWILTIQNDFEVDLGPDVVICDDNTTMLDAGPGSSFLWSTGETSQTIIATTTGLYSVDVVSMNGCCESDEIMVAFETSPSASATGAQLDCTGNAVQIFGNSSDPSASFMWSGPGGYTSNEQNPFVSAVGIYIVTVSSANGCSATAEAEVTANTDVPDVTAAGGVVTCLMTTVQLTSTSTVTGVTYAWTGPNGYTSNEQNPVVSEIGVYEVTVTAPNGCISSANAEVIDDTIIPDVSAEGGTIDCINTTVLLSGSSSAAGVSFSWEGPDGFTSSEMNPEVAVPGSYTLTVQGGNGCSSSATVDVELDQDEPNVSATGGTLDCTDTSVQLMGSSTTPDATFSWEGPDGFTSTDQNPIVSSPGMYTCTVIGPNGCSASTSVEVIADGDLPNATATGGTINCTNSSVQLMGSSTTSDVSFSWTGPNGFISSDMNPFVINPGEYTLSVMSGNGCVATATAMVEEDTVVPEVEVMAETITCDQPAIEISVSSSEEGSTYNWVGPNGFMSTEMIPMITEGGTYTVTVTAPNGCSTTATLDVIEDTAAPQASAEGGTIDCSNPTTMLNGLSSTPGVSIMWTGPNGFMSTENNPTVNEPGSYTFTVTAPNGCTNSVTVEVESDGDLPNISTQGGTIDCMMTSIQLMGSSTTENVTFSWEGPNGFTSNEMNPEVTEPGIYTLTIQSDNGCQISQNAEVMDDTNEPEIELTLGDVDCDEGTRIIQTQSDIDDLEVSWIGPNGFTSTELSPTISEAGTYIMETFPENGCNSTHFISMEDDVVYSYVIETIDIDDDNDMGQAEIMISGGTGPFEIEWDNGEMGTLATMLEAGEHTVKVTDGLGCIGIYTFEIKSLVSTFDQEWIDAIDLFPNPAQTVVQLDFNDGFTHFQYLEIIDLTGRSIQSFDLNGHQQTIQVDVEEWTAGVYVARIYSKDSSYSIRFVVQ